MGQVPYTINAEQKSKSEATSPSRGSDPDPGSGQATLGLEFIGSGRRAAGAAWRDVPALTNTLESGEMKASGELGIGGAILAGALLLSIPRVCTLALTRRDTRVCLSARGGGYLGSVGTF